MLEPFQHTSAGTSSAFAGWLRDRQPKFLSTNSGCEHVAFQNWRSLKEAFAPELIQKAVHETSVQLRRPVRTCIDPFGGSGTTALACQFLGVFPVTIEVNPFLSDLIEAKLNSYDYDALISAIPVVLEGSHTTPNTPHPFAHAPPTFVEPGKAGKYIFSKPVASRLAQLRERIDHLPNNQVRTLFRALLAAISVDVSNVTVSGKGRRYRRKWQARARLPSDVDAAFTSTIERAIYDIRRFDDRPEKRFQLIRGDARSLTHTVAGPLDLAVFSPPYPNSFDYTDVYNVELWVGGYLRSHVDNRLLREATLRSHVQIKRDYSCSRIPSRTLTRTLKHLHSVVDRLWDADIPQMISAYFDDMRCILSALAQRLTEHGRVYIAVGDSRYGGITIPVQQFFQKSRCRWVMFCWSPLQFAPCEALRSKVGNSVLLRLLLRFSGDRSM